MKQVKESAYASKTKRITDQLWKNAIELWKQASTMKLEARQKVNAGKYEYLAGVESFIAEKQEASMQKIQRACLHIWRCGSREAGSRLNFFVNSISGFIRLKQRA